MILTNALREKVIITVNYYGHYNIHLHMYITEIVSLVINCLIWLPLHPPAASYNNMTMQSCKVGKSLKDTAMKLFTVQQSL